MKKRRRKRLGLTLKKGDRIAAIQGCQMSIALPAGGRVEVLQDCRVTVKVENGVGVRLEKSHPG